MLPADPPRNAKIRSGAQTVLEGPAPTHQIPSVRVYRIFTAEPAQRTSQVGGIRRHFWVWARLANSQRHGYSLHKELTSSVFRTVLESSAWNDVI